jgi:hypothetical protein
MTEVNEAPPEESPAGWAQRWLPEIAAAKSAVEAWHTSGDKIIRRFKDERESSQQGEARMNLFSANVLTQQALLYGKTPKVSVGRRFADAGDDVARVAGELLERLLNADIERDGDSYAEALGYALQDRLLPGLGQVRIRYVAELETSPPTPAIRGPDGVELAPEVPGVPRKTYECVETDYVAWKDFLWSPARIWHEVRWVAFKACMSRRQVKERFDTPELVEQRGGVEVADAIPYTNKRHGDEDKKPDPLARAEVWELWDKETRRVFWLVEGFGLCLDTREDPLSLRGFFPCPRPILANATTDKVLPRPDFVLSQDQYDEIDAITTRINLLQKALSVRGVYDRGAEEVKRLLTEAAVNELIPVEHWNRFAERGGLKGSIDWLPLEPIVAAIAALDARREVAKAALYEVTGMSDLLRGQAVTANATATEQSIKARFASVRLQALQDEFARFASDVQRLKAEVICSLYDEDTILTVSNAQYTADAAVAPQAVAMLKERFSNYRVQVKPENVSMQDFAEMKSERMEVVAGVSQFLTAAAPLAQQMPGSTPFLLRILQWTMAATKGASEIEGVLDQAIQQAQQAASQPQQQAPDPKLIAQQMKGQQDMQKVQAETQARLVEIQAEVAADEKREQNQMRYNVMEANAKAQISKALRPEAQQGPGGPRSTP